MKQQNFTTATKVYLAIAGIVIFGLGIGVRHRIAVSDQTDNLTVVGPNQSIQNSLTEMNIRDVVGVMEIGGTVPFSTVGQLYFNVRSDNHTEVHVRVAGLPLNITNAAEKNQQKSIPRVLSIMIARRSFDGTNFEYQQLGTMSLQQGEDEKLSGKFSTILPPSLNTDNKQVPALLDAERIVFDTESAGAKNIFSDKNPDLPAEVRNNPSPFLWTVI
jgi:hypothetical protein